MTPKRFIWQLFFSLFSVVLISISVLMIYSVSTYHRSYLATIEKDLKARTILAARVIEGTIDVASGRSLDSLSRSLSAIIDNRITVILPSGEVIVDSHNEPDTMQNHATRPEFIDAMNGGIGINKRFSTTMSMDMLYCAVSFKRGQDVRAVVRLAQPLASIKQAQTSFYWSIISTGCIMLIISLALSYHLAKRISKPLGMLEAGVQRFAAGDLEYRLPHITGEETAKVARAFNLMANQLAERINMVTRQHNEQSAILSSMTEGVVAVDPAQRIIMINRAAIRTLDSGDIEPKGMLLHEVVRNSDIKEFFDSTMNSDSATERTLEIIAGEKVMVLLMRGTVIRDSRGNNIGALLVFNDITELKRLETVRKDFVANVSHELRTPLTAIKGFAETLMSMPCADDSDTKRFLQIMIKKTDLLCAIVDDLLTLARIEREGDSEITIADGSLDTILNAAQAACQNKAETKNIRIVREGTYGPSIRMDERLLEQAVVNLIDNAIKYSDPDKTITVAVVPAEREVVIEVRDQGYGIAKQHLSRLFERFYRVDKARSRSIGGSGLGLSIVKNIVQLHKGSVSVDSVPGQGSIFRIHLPV